MKRILATLLSRAAVIQNGTSKEMYYRSLMAIVPSRRLTHTHTQVGQWDMIIAFPPCTHLAVSGAAWFEKKRADGRQREGIEFFGNFFESKCEKVVIENPVGIISGDYIPKYFPDLAERFDLPKKPTQIIHPGCLEIITLSQLVYGKKV